MTVDLKGTIVFIDLTSGFYKAGHYSKFYKISFTMYLLVNGRKFSFFENPNSITSILFLFF